MRRYLEALYGNSRTKERLGSSVANGTLPHALILEGAEGSGKRTLAKELAAALVCENKGNESLPLPCHQCRACRLVEMENATDVHFITKEDKATLGVDVVRDMRQDVYLSATEFDSKIYIFEDAHTMTPQAQNALLIVLEEPPTGVYFILLAESADELLVTVRSRARTIRLEKHTEEALGLFLAERHPTLLASQAPDALRAACLTADGSAGMLLRLLEPKNKEQMQKKRALTLSLLGALSAGRYSLLCEAFASFPSKRDELRESLSHLSLAVRDLIVLKKDETAPLCFFSDRAEWETLLSSFRTDKLFAISDEIGVALERLDRNANPNTVLSIMKAKLRSK